jgi:predicted Zn-dependent protease
MRQLTTWIAVAVAGSGLVLGCGKKEEAPPAPAVPAAQESAPAVTAPAAEMPAAEPAPATMVDLVGSAKSGVEQAMALATEGKYQEALNLLQQKVAEVQSNPDARKLIDEAMAKVKQMMSEAATGAATDALGGLGKSLGQ